MKNARSDIMNFVSHTTFLSGLKAKWQDESGVAAVEFALILPLMLTCFLGAAALTKSIQAYRKVDLVSHALADLASQQQTCVANVSMAPCFGAADVTGIISAAKAILAPYSASALKVTLSQVQIYKTSGTPSQTVAYVNWSVTSNGAVARKCSSGGTVIAPETNATMQANSSGVKPTQAGFENQFPGDIIGTTANPGNPGFYIVADVVYPYTPLYGFSMWNWNSPALMNFGRSHFVRSRSLGVTSSQPAPIVFYPAFTGSASMGTGVNATYCKVYT